MWVGFGIDPTHQVIGFACADLGNKRKGFVDLAEALALLPESLRRRVSLLSFGRAPGPELRTRIAGPWIHLGFLDTETAQVAAYSAMDVFVIPSRAEAFGLTALEAAACGATIVGTNVGGIPEVLHNGGCGVLCRAGDAADLRGQITAALEPGLRRPGTADTAHNRIQEAHAAATCARRYVGVCRQVSTAALRESSLTPVR